MTKTDSDADQLEQIDQSLPRTQQRIETYLRSVLEDNDAIRLRSDDEKWVVESLSDTQSPTGNEPLDKALTEGENRSITLVRGAAADAIDSDSDGQSSGPARSGTDPALASDVYELSPGSELIEEILRADTMVGSDQLSQWDIVDGIESIDLPPAIANSDVQVRDRTFNGYYNRTALWVLFDISLETVSEFERDLLVPVAIDMGSGEHLPTLTEWFTQFTDHPSLESSQSHSVEKLDAVADSISSAEVRDTISTGQEILTSLLEPSIEEIRSKAIAAAETEFENYVELQEERLERLQEEITDLRTKLTDVSDKLEAADDRGTRLSLLDRKKTLDEKLEEKLSRREDLEEARDEGFVDKQDEIRKRHSLQVDTKALQVIVLHYEKGDLVLDLESSGVRTSFMLPFGRGVGLTEELTCEKCGELLDDENSLKIDGDAIVGQICCQP